jgi:exodeoxyribonuclease V alpha subunit
LAHGQAAGEIVLTMATSLPAFVAGAQADVRGTLVGVHFRDERGFAVFSIQQADRSRVRALGHLPADATLHAVVRVGGIWTEHRQYGWQVRANTVELIDEADRSGVVAFLVAYTKHLGPARASEAVARFGDRIFEVLSDDPEQLCVIRGITPSRARAIGESFARVADVADIDSWLRQIGLGRADARRVREQYGDDAARLVRENPYRLADDIAGIGFLTADSLRRRLGIAPTSPFRLHAALKYVLGVVARGEGHVYLPLGELVDRAARQLDERRATAGRWEPSAELVEALRAYIPRFATSRDACAGPASEGAELDDETPIYARDLHQAEQFVAERLAQLVLAEEPLFRPADLERAVRRAEAVRKLVLEADQRQAIATALQRQLSIISGGPGTGKTTTTQVLVDLLEERGVPYLLLSPTGKAAKRLAEATGREAHTVHRQLYALQRQRAEATEQGRDADELFLPAGTVIVDEVSMVDLPLLAWLLRSVEPMTRLVLVGDKDQLPSVGPGSVLRDLTTSRQVPVTLLTIVKRQAAGSPIVAGAHAINQGKPPVARTTDAGDLYILRARTPAEDGGLHAQRLVVESAARLGAQVLSPQHASPVGVAALNRALQARLNPPAPSRPEVAVTPDLVFRLGDRLIVGKNNYRTLCFNGETGEIVDIGPEQLELRLEDAQGERRVVYEREDWWQLQLAYAITNHRAQGSEWPNVVVVVSQSHYLMLQRNLVYTALTRARKRAVLVVSGGLTNKQTGVMYRTALEVAVANDRIARRYSALAERLERAIAERRVCAQG